MRNGLISAKKLQSGFTLVELAISVMILGMLSLILGATYKALMGANTQAYIQEQTVINQKIATAMMNHLVATDRWEALTASDMLFTLPDPYNNGTNINYGITNTTLNSTPEYLAYHIQQQGVPLNKVNGDGTVGDMVRVYQKYQTAGLTTEVSFFNPGAGFTGGKIVLTYDLGVVYLTNCNRSKTTTCNRANALPNSQSGNLPAPASLYADATWSPLSTDIGVTYVSSLPAQMALLDKFKKQLDQLRTSLKNYAAAYSASPLQGRALACSNAGVSDTGNTSPYPRNLCSAKNYAYVGTNLEVIQSTSAGAAANQGCWDGWYPLNSENVSILKEVGLPVTEYGTTPWGGPIEYCADYTPADYYGGTAKLPSKLRNVKPIYAAIRFNRYVTERSYPSTDTNAQYADNIIISF